MSKKFSISLLIVSILLGIVIGLQVRTIKKNLSVETPEGVLRSKELAIELKKVREERDNQRAEIEKLNNLIMDYESRYKNRDDKTKILYDEIEKFKKLAGLTDVSGKGIILTINDVSEINTKLSSILDNPEIILRIISVLNSSGAEAISINGQRVSAYTEVEKAGHFLQVNGVNISSPIIIKAIGDKDTVIPALNIKTGVIDILRNYKFDVVVSEDDNVIVEKINLPKDFKYAESIKYEK